MQDFAQVERGSFRARTMQVGMERYVEEAHVAGIRAHISNNCRNIRVPELAYSKEAIVIAVSFASVDDLKIGETC